MNKVCVFQPLIDLARNNTQKAGKELGLLVNERHRAQARLTMLHDYRLDYAHRLQQATQTGLSASSYQNFSKFIATLDEAISQQDRVVARKETQEQQTRQHWQTERRRLKGFEALEARTATRWREQKTRSEQIVSDEMSAGMHRRRRNI